MASEADVTHPNEHDAYAEACEEFYRRMAEIEQPITTAERRLIQRARFRAFRARWGESLAALQGIALALLVTITAYKTGFNDGQTHVLDLVCQVAGQSFDAASKLCIG